jgi:hypothetical protein
MRLFLKCQLDCLPAIQEQLDFKELFQEALEKRVRNQV